MRSYPILENVHGVEVDITGHDMDRRLQMLERSVYKLEQAVIHLREIVSAD